MDNLWLVNALVPFVVIGGLLWAAYSFMRGYCNPTTVKPLKIPDRFDIGYIDDPVIPPTVVNNYHAPAPVPAPHPLPVQQPVAAPAAPVVVAAPAVNEQLKEQCSLALQGLGHSATAADKKAATILSSHPEITDVAAFLRKAL